MAIVNITPLGTVSPYPKGKMNCPSFLVEYGDRKILLDCGNGCTSMLKFPYILDNLLVIISHYHKDHYSDIGAIQYASYAYNNLGMLNKPVEVYLPLDEIENAKSSITSNHASFCVYHDIDSFKKIKVLDMIITFYDNKSHSIPCYVISLEVDGLKIVYTADVGSTNMDKLADFCKNADLLICESSFLREHNSNVNTHLKAYEAGILACKADVKKLLLTHFWPEEDKEKYLNEAKREFVNSDVAVEGKKMVLKGVRR